MSRVSALLFAAALLAAPAPPAAVGPSGDLDGDGLADRARVERRDSGVWLVLETSRGAVAERPLGDEEIPFQLDGRESRLAVKDVNGDGRAEIVVAAGEGSKGLLYLLGFDGRRFTSLNPDADAFVSETGAFPEALSLDSKGRVTIAALHYDEDRPPREALFTFEWSPTARRYVLTATDLAGDD